MKKNLTQSRTTKTTGSFFRIPNDLKEEAQIFAIKNKMNLTDIVLKGMREVIKNG